MMRWNSFGRTLGFGALAAGGLLAASFLPLPTGAALSAWLVASAVAYGVGLAPSAAGAARTVLPIGALGLAVWLAAEHVGQAALGAALVVGIGRSLLVYRARPLRGLAVEAVLLGGGLWLARALLDGGLGSAALAVWGFFLVQSLFFWIPGVAEREDSGATADPFERAARRLRRLLEEEPVTRGGGA
ncbi:MAG: hypothetical protein ABFS46_09215 [Myxococcota bacterium]